MIVDELLIHGWFVSATVKYGFEIAVIVIVAAVGTWMTKRSEEREKRKPVRVKMAV